MRILIFSTNSNIYDGKNISSVDAPSCQSQWEKLAEDNPEHDFIVATQKPGMFLLDLNEDSVENKDIYIEGKNIRFEIIQEDDEEKIANFLATFGADVAIAASFYVTPLDWLTIKDAIVAEKLREKGIRTICHPLETAVNCFDKWRTHQTLERFGFNVAKAVYVHHELFINGGNRREIKSNVYKSSVLAQIEKLRFPVVVKDTVGLSSYGMDVLENFSQVRDFLKSKRFTSDRIIEEFIQGLQFGTEIHGTKGNHKVLPPFIFSVNKYGITSPKQSIKIGPVEKEEFRTKELEKELLRLAENLDFQGIAQVDLVFSEAEKKWYIIEINPRLSGMSNTYSVLKEKSVPQMLVDCILNEEKLPQKKKISMNMKFALLPKEKILELSRIPFVKFIHQIENKAAKQIRELGYCEVIFEGETKENLLQNLQELKERFPNETEENFVEMAKILLEKI